MVRLTVLVRCGLGFYVAVHPWLTGSGYVKVGCTADFTRRLEMASFTTCFTPEWSYYAVFRCESMKEAFLLEQAVLFLFKERRVPQRELIKGDAQDVTEGARRVCSTLNLNALVNMAPVYIEKNSLPPDYASSGRISTEKNSRREAEAPKLHTLEKYMGSLEKLRESMVSLNSPCDAPTDDDIFNSVETGDGEDYEIGCDFEVVDALGEETFSLAALRPYQKDAVARCLEQLDSCGATICQMACRCGKTPVAYDLIRRHLEMKPNSIILYLVPGLALLRQTARKLYSYGLKDVPFLLIGSDSGSIFMGDGCVRNMTTDAELIRSTISSCASHLIVISTYQSSHIISKMPNFALTVFDECHRVCGSDLPTNFNNVLLQPRCGRRLFLTATPAYDTPLKMDNTYLFGDIAYRYYLREGIDAGYVNPFAVRIVLGESMDDMNPYFYEAMNTVDKMIVYCRCIEHATKLAADLKHPLPDDITPFDVLLAHSRMGSAAVASVLRDFSASRRCLLLNVRLLQEGVEIPDLNAVFFAAPRYSSRDIVQSICRPLNKMENKPISYVFLPATINKRLPEDHPVNLEKFSTLVPFTDALMDEDPLLFEYLIDPHKVSYDVDVVGVRSLKLSSERLRRFVLPAIRRGVRYSSQNTDRLHRATRLPWKNAFNEMKRIVLECNRYPKTNDAWVIGKKSVSMALFYRYCRKGYRQYLDKEPSCLRMHQIRDLESLPLWRTYGLHGPYPWEECLNTLREYLEAHGSVPPLDVHKGGYIGLDATPFERLCGVLMHVNQCDACTKLRLDPAKQKQLDRLCKPFGLKWKKGRDKDGKILPGEATFITDSYDRFKALYEDRQKNNFQEYLDTHFPGYPLKHERMEDPRNLRKDRVPPRHVSRDEVTNPRKAGKVMCRVCRRNVAVRVWEQHLKSKAHRQNMK
ncbi:helicase-like protein [Trypanosoma equiperdum]|uniref:Probable helicase A859L n=2 Tax=Trypanozoon TaxID=39700 RepID=Q389B2_TRYB2|nr:helicase [Trypanosoma brucei brucei TREU927]EAN78608.1 helicase-like protein [Trypanosoma brucei brucei TREU927]SCU65038.1 helicase-like protein [Trypanosoma equiperdum]